MFFSSLCSKRSSLNTNNVNCGHRRYVRYIWHDSCIKEARGGKGVAGGQ